MSHLTGPTRIETIVTDKRRIERAIRRLVCEYGFGNPVVDVEDIYTADVYGHHCRFCYIDVTPGCERKLNVVILGHIEVSAQREPLRRLTERDCVDAVCGR